MSATTRNERNRRQLHAVAVDRYLRRRRIRKWAGRTTVVLLLATSLYSHWRSAGDDWSRLNHRAFVVDSVSGDTIVLKGVGPVHSAGVYVPKGTEPGAAAAATFLDRKIVGRSATLYLPAIQTRTDDGVLSAYLFVDGHENLSVTLAAAGLAYADRRTPSALRGAIYPAEATARKKSLGLWDGLKSTDMPTWRQDWLKSFARRTAAVK